ncbi:MAG: inositol monophosphatase [Rhodocyclaceae bacterium]|nr:inositol monophosphatase [Rhodocyclaceae bacterium]
MYELELKTAANAARQAGKLLTAMAIRGVRVDYKGAIDLVTEADRASEALIVKILRKVFPTDDIMTEESENERTKSARRWIIDPLDGTTNYAHQFPFWCVSIAFEHHGQVQAGAVYNPNLKELFTARRGHGGHLNGSRLKVSRQPELARCLLATGFPYDVHTSERDNLEHFRRFIKRAQAVRRPGSAAIDLAYVACGRFDGFWEIKLKPWDMAAASLLVTEAGGAVSRFDGSPFDLYVQECLASNGLVHRAMIDVLR